MGLAAAKREACPAPWSGGEHSVCQRKTTRKAARRASWMQEPHPRMHLLHSAQRSVGGERSFGVSWLDSGNRFAGSFGIDRACLVERCEGAMAWNRATRNA